MVRSVAVVTCLALLAACDGPPPDEPGGGTDGPATTSTSGTAEGEGSAESGANTSGADSSTGGDSDEGTTTDDTSGEDEDSTGSTGGEPEGDGIEYGNDGSGSDQGTADCTVETTDPEAALSGAGPGDVICVMGGSHGDLGVDDGITLRAIGTTEVGSIEVTGDGVTIDGFTVTGSGNSGAAIRVSGSGHTIVRNYVETTEASFGILVNTADDTVVRSNTVTKIQHWGMDVRGNGNVIERNNIFDLRRDEVGSDVDGIKFHGEDMVIRENYIHDINQFVSAYDSDPPHVDCFQTHDKSGLETRRVLIERNYCVRVSRQCLIAESPTVGDIVFRDNICETHDNQNINVKRTLTGGVWIYNNYLAGSPQKAIYTNSGSGQSNDPDVYIVNNVARGNPGDDMAFISGPSTVEMNNILVEEPSPFVRVPEFDSPSNDTYPEYEWSDFEPDGPRAFVRVQIDLDGSIEVPALPGWLDSLEGASTDIDGHPRQIGSGVDQGPFEHDEG